MHSILQIHNRYKLLGGEDFVVDNEYHLLSSKNKVRQHISTNSSITVIKPLSLIKCLWNNELPKEIGDTSIVHIHNTFFSISPSVYFYYGNYPIVQSIHNFRMFCINGLMLKDGTPCLLCQKKVFPYPGIFYKCYKNSIIQSFCIAFIILFRKLLRIDNQIDAYIVLSNYSKDLLIESGISEKKVFIKPNFIERYQFNKEINRTHAVFVGRLSEEKGINVLLSAWAYLKEIPLTIIGEGPCSNLVVERMKDNKNISFLGFVQKETVLCNLKSSTFAIIPSICYENFPLLIVEAFSSGTPVIASNIGSIAELILDHKTGLLFEPGNPNDLAEKVRWAWEHPEEMAQMGRNARAEYEAKYTAEKNYEMLMEIYQKAIENHNARKAAKKSKWSISRLFTARKNSPSA